MRTWTLGLIACAGLLVVLQPARASLETDLLERWYALLGRADGSGLSRLLDPRARIRLDDLGVTQTKAQFIASMDEWSDAIEGGSISYKVETARSNAAVAVVCYKFKDGELQTRESFKFRNGLVTESQQKSVAEVCD